MPKKLDRKRDFGTVYGSEDGTAYEQDGVHFDAYDNEIIPFNPVISGLDSDDEKVAAEAQAEKAQKISAVRSGNKPAAPAAVAVTAAKKGKKATPTSKKATPATVPSETTGFSNEDQLNAQSGSGDA